MNRQEQSTRHWLRLPMLLLVAVLAVGLLAATALAEESASDGSAMPASATPPPDTILISTKSNGKICRPTAHQAAAAATNDDDDDDGGGSCELTYRNEDILRYSPLTDAWEIFWDGSDHGLGPVNVEDFEYDPTGAGALYFTINKAYDIPNPNGTNPLSVDDSDIIKYDFATDSFSIFAPGTLFGLTTGSEDIDAFAFNPANGHVLISTIGSVQANGVSARDEDVLECVVATGQCSLYMDNSDIALTKGGEDAEGLWVDPVAPNNHLLTFKGSWRAEGSVNSVSGKKNDVLGCEPITLGSDTDCTLFTFFTGKDIGLRGRIDGIWVSFPPLAVHAVQSASANEANEVDAIDEADFAEATSANDEEIDAYDFVDVARQVFMPALFGR